jgi:hypothetical protein
MQSLFVLLLYLLDPFLTPIFLVYNSYILLIITVTSSSAKMNLDFAQKSFGWELGACGCSGLGLTRG